MVEGFERAISSPMRPMMGLTGRPLPDSFVHVFAPSVVFHKPLPGPPPLKPQGVRRRWYDAAMSTSGFDGFMATSVNPVFSSMNFVFVQVLPPSVVLYSPRSWFGPNKCPSAATYAMSGSFGWTTMRAMLCVSLSPMVSKLFPPSIDL